MQNAPLIFTDNNTFGTAFNHNHNNTNKKYKKYSQEDCDTFDSKIFFYDIKEQDFTVEEEIFLENNDDYKDKHNDYKELDQFFV